MTEVYLEAGRSKVFACAVDWPGWERAGKTEEAALEALAAYGPRYAAATGAPTAGPDATDRFDVVERLAGTATTDFGAPDARSAADRRPLPSDWLDLLDRAWQAFDATVAASTPVLTKGPRGGGRDRDAIADHVREAERSYGRGAGAKVPPRTPWPDQRAAIRAALPHAPLDGKWPPRYTLRRMTWHVLDHLWEIEDKQTA